MRVAKEATLLARRRHTAGERRLQEVFAYDPLKPPRPPQHGGKVKRGKAVN